MSKYRQVVAAMSTNELEQRIKATGSKEFKAALEAELATRNSDAGEVIEGSLVESDDTPAEISPETVQDVVEEPSTDVQEEAEVVSEEPVEAPKKRTRSRKTTTK